MNNTNNIIYISSVLDKKEKKEERDSSRVSKDSSKYNNNIVNNQLLIDGIVYLPLSLEVYGWLRQQMDKAHVAYKGGKLAEDSWNGLREKFYPVHEYVVASYGKAAIENVLQTVQENPFAAIVNNGQEIGYCQKPATEHIYPLDGDYLQSHPVPPEALAQVDAIRDKAIKLGWAESQLYQNCGRFKFPYGSDYGIVCYLGSDSKIGEVTRQHIEIVGTSGKSSRFYNENVVQPWIKRLQAYTERGFLNLGERPSYSGDI